jgi:hypothetical protein
LKELTDFLVKIPAVRKPISSGTNEDGLWWTKFSIDIQDKLAWNVVQELGHIVNYVSLEERLPTAFYPVSPPPYMNGGPTDFLSWIIETKDKDFKPEKMKEWLEGRLPNPVDDPDQWNFSE